LKYSAASAGSGAFLAKPASRRSVGSRLLSVAGKFSATSRQYETYKAKNGMRLDREWNELTTFIQFKMNGENLDDAVRRIESFRSKMQAERE